MKKTVIAIALLISILLPNASYAAENDTDMKRSQSETVVYLDDHTYYVVPPEDFDPLIASDAELKKYGFPERPNDEEGLAFWESLYSVKPTFIEPVQKTVTDWHSSRLELAPDLADEKSLGNAIRNTNSLNWSGVVINSNANIVSSGANCIITIPTISADASYRPASCAGWVGLGGTGGNSLAQLGFVGEVDGSGSVTYKVWHETVGTNVYDQPVEISSFSLSPGDSLFLSVWLDFSATSGLDIHYYFYNQSQYSYTNVVVNVTSYSNFTSSAEWIMERKSTGSYTYDNLAKPTTSSSDIMSFSSCNYKNMLNSNAWTTAAGGTVYDMVNILYIKLAQGSSFSSGAMSVSWKKYK